MDALLVLGSPADLDGAVTPTQQSRVKEAVEEYRKGLAPQVLFSGGAAANRFVEAEVMATYAMKLGLPLEAILKERTSKTTLENLRNSQQILDAHGWRRVEVISSPEHLARAAVFLKTTHLLWRVHAAPFPERSALQTTVSYVQEAIGTTAVRWFGTRAEPVVHAVATVVRAMAFAIRWVFYKAEWMWQKRVSGH